MKNTILTTSCLIIGTLAFGQTSTNASGGGTSNASGSISYSIQLPVATYFVEVHNEGKKVHVFKIIKNQ